MDELTLREQKHIKTKIKLGQAFLKEVKQYGFAKANIKRICKKVDISEATFFNYFPTKIDLLRYSGNFFFLNVAWQIKNTKVKAGLMDKLLMICDSMFKDTPMATFYDMIAIKTSNRLFPQDIKPLSDIEKIYAFQNYKGIENIKEKSIPDLFFYFIDDAIEKKTLKTTISSQTIVLGLTSILIGIPLYAEFKNFKEIRNLYKKQFTLFLNGIQKC
ncbi:MAG: TetR family transcriptional regulator [Elusimicrobiota bacterium]|nr:TetR family transcriptional regulator [Elusimicrobiota bacterium]